MKIGTDAVLLGAWTACETALHILDVGSGCGILSLMLAQRCQADVVALEPDAGAFGQAEVNFRLSPWSARISAVKQRLQDLTSDTAFDLIICNPPFFGNALPSPDPGRSLARHDDSLSLEELFTAAAELGSDDVRISLVLPFSRKEDCIRIAAMASLFPHRILSVKTFASSPFVRVMMEFGRTKGSIYQEEMVLRDDEKVYSSAYQQLTVDYHPHFV